MPTPVFTPDPGLLGAFSLGPIKGVAPANPGLLGAFSLGPIKGVAPAKPSKALFVYSSTTKAALTSRVSFFPNPAFTNKTASPPRVSHFANPAFKINFPITQQWDIVDGGPATVYGTVTKIGPPSTALRTLVRLYNEFGRRFIRATYSDATTGAFSFTKLKADEKYTIIVYDITGQYRAVIRDGEDPKIP